MRKLLRVLPRSLVGRVYALYTLTLAIIVAAALGLFYRYQFARELEAAQQRSDALVDVIAPTIADNAVIGDYDTIQKTLARAAAPAEFAYAAFLDLRGGVVRVDSRDPPEVVPPAWLVAMVEHRLYETNLPIVVGGHDYGVLRLGYAAEHIAGDLWREARLGLVLALAGLACGLLLIWWPLKHWLGNLGRLHSMGEDARSGALRLQTALADDAPIELRRTFEAFNEVAATLQSQREQAAVTLGAIADGVFTLDVQGRIVLANPAAADMVAGRVEDARVCAAHEILPELFDGLPPYRPWRGRRLTIVARRGDRIVDTTLSPIVDPAGRLEGYVLACHDVSEQQTLHERLQDQLRSRETALTSLRRALEAILPAAAGRSEAASDDIEAVSHLLSALVQRLREHSDQLGAIFALSPDGFVCFDGRGTISYVSPAFSRLTGIADAEAIGLDEARFARLLAGRCLSPAAALPSFDSLRAESREAQRRRFVELDRPARRTLELALRRGEGGNVLHVLHLRDVTLESEVDQMKSEFLSTAAHELRTPMASIYGFSELMMHRRLSAERQQEVISTIYRQTGLMIAIVNELLDLARIEARRGKDFVIETLDLRELVTEVVHDFKPADDRHPPRLRLPPAPIPVRVDRGKSAQALRNVLSNAFKYSPGGGAVELDVVVRAAGEAGPCAGLRVRDRGIGMTPEQLGRVCERFYRADASGGIPGTGLGMSIVKEIVELLGGSLAIASTPGEGTEVTLWLPLATTAREVEPVA